MVTFSLVTTIVILVLSTMVTIAQVGKERPVITPGVAASNFLLNGLLIAGLAYVLLVQ